MRNFYTFHDSYVRTHTVNVFFTATQEYRNAINLHTLYSVVFPSPFFYLPPINPHTDQRLCHGILLFTLSSVTALLQPSHTSLSLTYLAVNCIILSQRGQLYVIYVIYV